MRIAGLLLLLTGWILALAAVVLLVAPGPRAVFLLAGLGVEILGLIMVARSHVTPKEDGA
ncbi:MAG TPA: hypothetical protein VFE47_00815 [Tepidisphaeraceae bacterium]|jgi:hypothetical protein|nr:hypothetical protein [Tepidisphaeraceae bacterium]